MSDSPKEIPTFEELAADPEIAALLDFDPVPRQREAEAPWTPEKQREFIARLAFHASQNRACAQMAKSQSGLSKLYHAPLAASFRGAWHGAIALAKRRREEAVPEGPPALQKPPTIDYRIKHGRYAKHPGPLPQGDEETCLYCGAEVEPEWRRLQREREEQLRGVRQRLMMARRIYLSTIARDPDRRAAWELLCGPADWAAALKMGEQPDEKPDSADISPLREATMQIPLKTGFMPHLFDPEWDDTGDTDSQFEESVAKHDPRCNGSTEPNDAGANAPPE